MANNEAKRQHYVPRTYLKHFANQKGADYFINALQIKPAGTGKIFQSNISNVCLENNLYTVPGETAEQRMFIEKFYSDEIENHYDKIYEMLVDPERVILTKVERELIISTVVTMFFRTTRRISTYNEVMKQVYARMFQICEKGGKDYFMADGQKISIAGTTLDSFHNNHKVEVQPIIAYTQIQTAINLIRLRLMSDDIVILRLNDLNYEFITSDNPVFCSKVTGGHISPGDPKNMLNLPLDARHMLFLKPNTDNSTKHTLIKSDATGSFCESLKILNHNDQTQNAERFILGSDASLKSYLRTKEKF